MRYTVTDVPPLGLTVLLGFQHYLTMLGSTVLIPLLLVPAMGGNGEDLTNVICTIFFVSGLNTLVQTTVGDRLPIIQGGSFAFLGPTFGIIGNPEMQAILDPRERFKTTMCCVQGAIIVCALVQMALAYTGLFAKLVRYISPLVIAPVVTVIGLSLYAVGIPGVSECLNVGLFQIGAMILFSQLLNRVNIPMGRFGQFPLFKLFPVLCAVVLTWSYAGILTAANVWEEGSVCRADSKVSIINDSEWFRFPYPGQWGAPIFRAYAIVPMLGGALASMVESVGDYYACAQISGAPPPSGAVIARGIGGEGFGMLISGIWGSGNGTTSYSENVGALAVTRVGSRVVVQMAGILMIAASLFTKFGAVLASIPAPMVSGLYCCLLGLIAAVGLSNLQHVDLNSPRNLFILGFTLFNSMSIAGPGGYFDLASRGAAWPCSTMDGGCPNGNPFMTNSSELNSVLLSLFNSAIIMAWLIGFLLDIITPGTREERGFGELDKLALSNHSEDPEFIKVYALPNPIRKLLHNCSYLERIESGKWPAKTPDTGGRGTDICSLCWPGSVWCGGKRDVANTKTDEAASVQVQEA